MGLQLTHSGLVKQVRSRLEAYWVAQGIKGELNTQASRTLWLPLRQEQRAPASGTASLWCSAWAARLAPGSAFSLGRGGAGETVKTTPVSKSQLTRKGGHFKIQFLRKPRGGSSARIRSSWGGRGSRNHAPVWPRGSVRSTPSPSRHNQP